MQYPPYSVLLSIYAKEKSGYLRQALDSMLAQTVAPAEIVMVKDGPLTPELDAVLGEYDHMNPGLFKFVSYGENHGLGYALREGALACSNEIIARMDTDDVAMPDRLEKQLTAIEGGLDMVGSQIVEFIDSPDKPVATTNLPEGMDAIVAYSKRRNPFRHSPMTFKRSKVLEAGNYSSEFLFFEDWDLFNRMLSIGCRAGNIHEPLVAVRVSEDFYARRGGLAYLKYAWKFKAEQVRSGWFNPVDFIASFVPHAAACLMPNGLRAFVYKHMLRSKPAE